MLRILGTASMGCPSEDKPWSTEFQGSQHSDSEADSSLVSMRRFQVPSNGGGSGGRGVGQGWCRPSLGGRDLGVRRAIFPTHETEPIPVHCPTAHTASGMVILQAGPHRGPPANP